jgi:rod shape-determining protein MreC
MQAVVQRRPTLLFLVVLSCLFFLMTRSKETRYLGETRTLFERMVMTIFSPVPRTVNWFGQATSDLYHGYLDMRREVQANVALRHKVAELTQQNLKLQQSSGELARMRSILGYAEQFNMPTILAQVVMLDNTGRFNALILDRGSQHGVEVNDPVVSPDGLVGRVVLTTAVMSKVQLITDTNSTVGAVIERTRRQGVVRGNGVGAQMFYVPNLTDVKPTDVVTTAGIDGVYPKGIPIGRVAKVEEGKELFKMIVVQSSIDFSSLEDVMIIHTRKIPEAVLRYPERTTTTKTAPAAAGAPRP